MHYTGPADTNPIRNAIDALKLLELFSTKTLDNIDDLIDLIQMQAVLDKFRPFTAQNKINIDMSKYETWDMMEMIYWISTLESGRFIKYLDTFKSAFVSDNYSTGKYLSGISTTDLRQEPFKILCIEDRTALVTHFQKLKRHKENRKRRTIYPRQGYRDTNPFIMLFAIMVLLFGFLLWNPALKLLDRLLFGRPLSKVRIAKKGGTKDN